MKKILCTVLALAMALSVTGMCFAANEKTLTPAMATDKSSVTATDSGIKGLTRKGYFGFSSVDLTGMNSVSVRLDNNMDYSQNGETLLVILDNPESGQVIGSVTLTELGEDVTVKAALTPVSGTHNLYFRCLYGKNTENDIVIKEIKLSDEKYVNDAKSKQVPDSAVIDNYSDTWVAVDDMGRSVADFEEVGSVKTDTREVGILYWDWFSESGSIRRATVISDIVNAHPEEKENYSSPVWDTLGKYYWGEPLLGFYTSRDYWVFRKHAEMLANAGIDAIFFDYSNVGIDYIPCLNILAQAFRDAKATGINVPGICAMMTLGGNSNDSFRGLTSIYYNCFVENDYTDIWYYWEGKPLIYANATYETAIKDVDENCTVEKELLNEIKDFFTFRKQGGRNSAADANKGSNAWMWLENFPQILRNPDETGRPEFVVVGVGINQSTIYGLTKTGVFSDQYSKGRGFSEVFREDFRDIGKRKAYFFREQSALALDAAPKFLMIDGWNEWTAVRGAEYNGFKNAFVDLYDEENSRDFEPENGALKDDYYNLMCDLIRKFKGVRPAPTASGMKTIDINADAAQWEEVGPLFVNSNQDYERDSYGYSKAREIAGGDVFEQWHYTTTVNNAIKNAKVSFDNDNIYFMVKTEKDIKENTENWMHLYINTDRNHATGWEGYDYAVNVNGAGSVATYNGTWNTVGNVNYTVKGDMLQVAIPRSLIGVTGTVDLEFKWTDSVAGDNILNFYKDGSSAPLGRFNYLYTEKAQTALSDKDRENLKGTTVIKAGANRMVANGGKMYVYEADTRITPFEMNGTLYIPEETFNEIMGQGRAKTRYEAAFNMLLTYHYDMSDDLTEIENYIWTYGTLGSNEIRVNGKIKYLSAPPAEKDGIIYIPVSMIEECYGWTVKALGNGVYQISDGAVSAESVTNALSHIE